MSDDQEFLTKEQILNAEDLKIEVVEVPEWGPGAKVRVRSLSGTDRDAFESSLIVKKKGMGGKETQTTSFQNIRAKLCALSIVDRNGVPMFTMADVDALGAKSAAALDRVFSVAQRLSKITEQDVDELVGNSEATSSDAP